jgi:hypothetical protein
MRETRISLPELALVGATRAMLGMGVGMLIAGRLRRARRRAIASTLLAIGALSTIPLGLQLLGKRRMRTFDGERRQAPAERASQPFAD